MQKILKILLCLCTMNVFAQDCKFTLRGTLVDVDNHEGLEYANIQLQPAMIVQQSDDKGQFTFTGLCAGSYSLLIQHVGCADTLVVIQVNNSKQIKINLPHAMNMLNSVEIITSHEEAKRTENMQTLTRKELDKTIGLSLGDQLKQLSGVTTMNTGPTISKPMINGMQGYRVLVLNNGVRQEGQQWGNEHAPEIDPFVAGRMVVLRGSSAVRYGSDAIGGVVMIEPAALPSTESLSGEINLSGFTNGRGGAGSVMLQGYFEKMKYLSWRVQASAKQNGSIKTPNYFLKNTAAQERNLSALMDYHRKNFGASVYYAKYSSLVGIFTDSHIGNLSDLYAAFNRSKPQDSLAAFSYEIGRPYQNIQHDLIKLSTDIHTGSKSRIRAMYAYQFNHRQEFDKNLPRNQVLAAKNLPEADYRLSTQNAELSWEHENYGGFRGIAGIQGIMQSNRYQQRFFIPNYDAFSAGVFAIERYTYSVFELEAGLRADYKQIHSYFYENGLLQSPQRSFQNVSYKLGGIFKPIRRMVLSLNFGSAWRSPAANELYSNGLHHGVGAIEHGDPNLHMEKCINGIFTFQYKMRGLQTDATIYSYHFQNFIYYYPGQVPELTIRGAFPVFYYAECKANISGADAVLQYTLRNQFTFKLRGMYLRGQNLDLKQPLIYMPSNRIEFSFELKGKNRKRIFEPYLEPSLSYISKQNRVPDQLDFVAPPNAYFLFGLNAGFEWHAKKQIYYLNFSITNAANTVYRDYLDRFRYYNDAAGSNYTLRIRIPISLYKKKQNEESQIEIIPVQNLNEK